MTSNHSVNWLFTNTAHCVFLYNASIMLTSLPLTPIVLIIYQRAVQQMVSKAALTSMKLKLRATLCFLAFSIIWRATKMASTVPFPRLKPNWDSDRFFQFCLANSSE